MLERGTLLEDPEEVQERTLPSPRRVPVRVATTFTFIVPVKNQLAMTRALIGSVAATNPGERVEWIIVDSGSTDSTADYCRRIGARVVPFRAEPFNYCAAVNAGAAHASGDVWIIANNDIEIRSTGDLARVGRAFRDWPILDVASPGRAEGAAELEFGGHWLNGSCWAVRPAAFRDWGGLPEALSGYGYDEFHTVAQCWRRGGAVARVTGWDVFHHGSATFGPLGATTTSAMRRNLSRLLRLLDAGDLDRGRDQRRILRHLCRRELARSAGRLLIAGEDAPWIGRQGYAGLRNVRPGEVDRPGSVWVSGTRQTRERRQWIPWLANELRLQPDARIVGGHGWYAVRSASGAAPTPEELDGLVWQARAVGPLPPPLMSTEAELRPNWRQRLAAMRNDFRHLRTRLPAEW